MVVNLIRGQVVKRLVKAFLIIKIEPIAEAVPKLGPAAKRVKVDVVVLERPPQPLYENIVLTPASAIHADGNAVALKQTRKGLACKLSALVGIEYFWSAVAPDSPGEGLDTEVGLHGIGNPPGEHLAAVPVHDRYQVHETPAHGDVRLSRPRGFHPQPLREPDVNLSAHPAPTTQALWQNSKRPVFEQPRAPLRKAPQILSRPHFMGREALVFATHPTHKIPIDVAPDSA